MPAGIIVVARGLVEPENHVVVRADVFGGVDDPPLESPVDLAGWQCDNGRSRPGNYLAAQAWDAHLEPFVVSDRGDLLPEPSAHLGAALIARARYEVERGVGLFVKLESVTVVEPRGHAFGVHAERDGREPLTCRLFRVPEDPRRMKRLDLPLGGGLEAVERSHDLPTREDLDPEPTATRLLNDLCESLGGTLVHIECSGPSSGHPPLDLRLGDDMRSIGAASGGDRRQGTAGCREEPASVTHDMTLSFHGDPIPRQ